MALKLNDLSRFKSSMKIATEKILKRHINAFRYTGEEFVNNAKLTGEYTDQTGNLRSSIGYIIVLDGIVLSEMFEEAQSGSDRKTGVEAGRQLAESLAKESDGLCLICVAGMNYSIHLEATGREVITGTAGNAKHDLLRRIQKVNSSLIIQ